MPVGCGELPYSPEQAIYRARELGGDKWVVKAQIHSGARGKAGGIKFCSSEQEVLEAATELFGKRLVTNQTGPQGKLVYRLYIESAIEIDREIYLAFILDRDLERVVCVASASGGMDIEEIAKTNPDSIIRVPIEPAVGMRDFQAREIGFALQFGCRPDQRSGDRPDSLLPCLSRPRRNHGGNQPARSHQRRSPTGAGCEDGIR